MYRLYLKYLEYRFKMLREVRDNIIREYDDFLVVYDHIINGRQHLVEIRYLTNKEKLEYNVNEIFKVREILTKREKRKE